MKDRILKNVLPAVTTLGIALAVTQGCGLENTRASSSVKNDQHLRVKLCGTSSLRNDHELSDGIWFKADEIDLKIYLVLQGEALEKAAKELGQGNMIKCISLPHEASETVVISDSSQLEFEKPATKDGTYALLDCSSADYPLGKVDADGATVRNTVKLSVTVKGGKAAAVTAKINMPGYMPAGSSEYQHSVRTLIDTAPVFRAVELSPGLVVFPAMPNAELKYTVEGFTGKQPLESVRIDQGTGKPNIRFAWRTLAEDGKVIREDMWLNESCKLKNESLLTSLLD